MPPPKDKQGVMRLLGMTNYLARFSPNYSMVTAPIRALLQKYNEFYFVGVMIYTVRHLKI